MTIYLTCLGAFALYIEINYKLGKYPCFTSKKHKTETIIQLPFTTIIFTPRHKLIGRTENKNETGSRKIHNTTARTTKN